MFIFSVLGCLCQISLATKFSQYNLSLYMFQGPPGLHTATQNSTLNVPVQSPELLFPIKSNHVSYLDVFLVCLAFCLVCGCCFFVVLFVCLVCCCCFVLFFGLSFTLLASLLSPAIPSLVGRPSLISLLLPSSSPPLSSHGPAQPVCVVHSGLSLFSAFVTSQPQ